MFARQTSKKRTLADVKWLSSKDIKKDFYSFRKMTSKLPSSAKFYYSTHLCVPRSYRHINSMYPTHFLFSLNLHSWLWRMSPLPLFRLSKSYHHLYPAFFPSSSSSSFFFLASQSLLCFIALYYSLIVLCVIIVFQIRL